jgi:heme exporter protein D
MRFLDFSTWPGLVLSVLALALITLVGVGIRLLVMQTIQARRQRENRQINERLRTLIAAYKTLGGSFTGNLDVDPTHLRDLRQREASAVAAPAEAAGGDAPAATPARADEGSDRGRRIRDAVEGALSDILLLGTDEQVRLAARAANDLVDGRRVRMADLVISLRDFIRQVLDLEPVPAALAIPPQGPTRPGAAGKGGARERGGGAGGASGGGGGGGGGAGGGGGGMGGAGTGDGAAGGGRGEGLR